MSNSPARAVDNFRSWVDKTPMELHEEIRELKSKVAKLEMELIKTIPLSGIKPHEEKAQEQEEKVLTRAFPSRKLSGLMGRLRGNREKLLTRLKQ